MGAGRARMARVLPGKTSTAAADGTPSTRPDAPRMVRKTLVDFTALYMPEGVRLALAEAFWSHYGIQSANTIKAHWIHVNTFDRFVREAEAIKSLADVNRVMLVRFIERLNAQCRRDGQAWSKARRSAPYTCLRRLLQWLARCRPGVISGIDYPFSPFPWRDRDNQPHAKITAHHLRSILAACEQDITQLRSMREAAQAGLAAANGGLDTLGGLLQHIDRHCDGIVPTVLERLQTGQHRFYEALSRFGGMREVEPCLYPRSESLLPYFLTILIHTAGNPEPIVNLQRDCLQLLPLLDDRQTLVWRKGRTPHMQRRTFSITAEFEPPTLVRELLEWNERLQALAPPALRERLFLFKTKGHRAVTALSASIAKRAVKTFCAQHALPAFSLASIRPSVLSAFYRTSGDLRQVRTVANHSQHQHLRALRRSPRGAGPEPHPCGGPAECLRRALRPASGARQRRRARGHATGIGCIAAGADRFAVRLRLQGPAGWNGPWHPQRRAVHELHGLLHLPQRHHHAGARHRGPSAAGPRPPACSGHNAASSSLACSVRTAAAHPGRGHLVALCCARGRRC